MVVYGAAERFEHEQWRRVERDSGRRQPRELHGGVHRAGFGQQHGAKLAGVDNHPTSVYRHEHLAAQRHGGGSLWADSGGQRRRAALQQLDSSVWRPARRTDPDRRQRRDQRHAHGQRRVPL